MSYIKCDYINKILELTKIDDNRRSISKYEAILYSDKLGFSWTGNVKDITIEYLIDLLGIPEWEVYQWSMVVKPGSTHDQKYKYIEEAGVRYDYILEVYQGPIEILHITNDIEYLSSNGFYVTEENKMDLCGHSMGLGLYAFDKSLFDKYNIDYSNYNIGIYNGIYFRCVDDTANGDKCGSKDPWKQELLLPFNTHTIQWI